MGFSDIVVGVSNSFGLGFGIIVSWLGHWANEQSVH